MTSRRTEAGTLLKSKLPLIRIYLCTIIIEGIGVLARGEALNKKESKNNAGEHAIYNLIKYDVRARRIINDLLIKQSKLFSSSVQKSGMSRMMPYARTFPAQEASPVSKSAELNLDSTSLYSMLRNDENVYTKLKAFSNAISRPISWTISLNGEFFICECTMGDFKTIGQSSKKKTVAKYNTRPDTLAP